MPLESVIITAFSTPGVLLKPWKPLKALPQAQDTGLLRKVIATNIT